MVQTLRTSIDKWELMGLENVYKAKDIVNKTNQKPTDSEKKSDVGLPHLIERSDIQKI